MGLKRLYCKFRTNGNRFLQNIWNFKIQNKVNELVDFVEIVVGSREKAESNGLSFLTSGSAGSLTTKVNYTTNIVLSANKIYKTIWTSQVTTSSTGKKIKLKITIDGTVVFDENKSPIAVDEFDLYTAPYYFSPSTNKQVVLLIEWQKVDAGNYTASIKESKIDVEVWQDI